MRILFFLLLLSFAPTIEALEPPPNVHVATTVWAGGKSDNNASIDSSAKATKKQQYRDFLFEDQGIAFSNHFPGGKADRITSPEPGVFEVFSEMENFPINDSAWYAFKIWSLDGVKKEITIRLRYPNGDNGYKGSHRYWPKISFNKKKWSRLKSFDEETATLKLRVENKPIWVSAQELETSADVGAWASILAKKSFVSLSSAGTLKSGRSIPSITIDADPKKKKPVVVILGRHHPPEVTGDLALRNFVEALASSNSIFKRARENFSFVVFPLMNPDGVDAGFWRHNFGGADLNRDWGQFHHQETQFVSEAIKSLQREIVFSIDFHSTHKDVLYLPETKFSKGGRDLALEWIYKHGSRLPETQFKVMRLAHHRYKFTGLYWAIDTFGTPSVVYEVGDETDRKYLRKSAISGAQSLVEVLLDPRGL